MKTTSDDMITIDIERRVLCILLEEDAEPSLDPRGNKGPKKLRNKLTFDYILTKSTGVPGPRGTQCIRDS